MNLISIHIKCCHIKYIYIYNTYIQLVTVVWLTDKKINLENLPRCVFQFKVTRYNILII